MHTIKLHIEDKVFDKVIYFLKNLPKNEVEIVGNVVTVVYVIEQLCLQWKNIATAPITAYAINPAEVTSASEKLTVAQT